jgi:hypothetical protein
VFVLDLPSSNAAAGFGANVDLLPVDVADAEAISDALNA